MRHLHEAISYVKRWFGCVTFGGHRDGEEIRFDRGVQAVYQRCLNCGRKKYHWGELWA